MLYAVPSGGCVSGPAKLFGEPGGTERGGGPAQPHHVATLLPRGRHGDGFSLREISMLFYHVADMVCARTVGSALISPLPLGT